MAMNGKGQTAVTIMLILLGLLVANVFFGIGSKGTAGGTTTTTTSSGVTGCAQPASITMTVGPGFNKFNGSRVATIENATLFINGVENADKALESTLTTKFQDKVKAYYGQPAQGLYYTLIDEFEVPCGAFQSRGLDKNKGSDFVLHDSTPTLAFFNDEDANKNANGTAEELILAGEVGGAKLRIQTADDEAFAPGSMGTNSDGQASFLIVFDLNKTVYDESKLNIDSLPSGWTATPTGTPRIWDPLFGGESVGVTYEVRISGEARDNWLNELHFKIQTDSGQAGNDTAADINTTIYPKDSCKDSGTGQFIYAVEDSRSTLCGQTPASATLHVDDS